MKTIALVLLLATPAAFAQQYPNKPIRIVIAQAPGSATDVISRVVGNKLAEGLGQPVVIEAKPAPGGRPGTKRPRAPAPMGNPSSRGITPSTGPTRGPREKIPPHPWRASPRS